MYDLKQLVIFSLALYNVTSYGVKEADEELKEDQKDSKTRTGIASRTGEVYDSEHPHYVIHSGLNGEGTILQLDQVALHRLEQHEVLQESDHPKKQNEPAIYEQEEHASSEEEEPSTESLEQTTLPFTSSIRPPSRNPIKNYFWSWFNGK